MTPLSSFLDRIIPPGRYIVVAYQRKPARFFETSFSRTDIQLAADFCEQKSSEGFDVWFAVASFTKKRRLQINAEALRAFWFDADLIGGGKTDPAKASKDLNELKASVAAMCKATGILLPNVWVRSGYGVHLYWTFDPPMTRDEWQPHAETLKAALIAHGVKGDASVVADAARILRPIETFNYKIPANPAPCLMISKPAPDYDRNDLLRSLGWAPTTGSGRPATAFQRAATSMAANAKAGLTAAPRDFAVISQRCAQVARSLAEGGEHDGRQLWRGMLTLAFFCEDGRDWAHKLGEQHTDYKPDDTDAEFDRIDQEHQRKNFGATTCAYFDTERSGVCTGCPLHQQGKSPFTLGLATAQAIVSPDEPPDGYRRSTDGFEVYRDKQWHRLLAGDIRGPRVEYVGGDKRIAFDYAEPGGRVIDNLHVLWSELTDRRCAEIAKRGLLVSGDNWLNVTRMLMGWIEKLMGACAARAALPTFGWLHNAQYDGFAVGGCFYNHDGVEHNTAGADQVLMARYTPVGKLDVWRDIAAFVIDSVPELHVALALSFGAPLMELAGGTGGCIAFNGRSGVGKTSVFRVSTTVWSEFTNLMSLSDTENFKMASLGQTRSLPQYWDEAMVNKDSYEKAFELLHTLTQGREKGRLTSDIRMREQGTWETIYALAANASITELIAAQHTYRSATLLRVLEIELTHKYAGDPQAETRIAPLRHNYGHAGRVYAQYIATHQPQVKALLDKAGIIIVNAIGSYGPEERFHLSMAKSIVAGAAIARQLGLVPTFDVPGIVRVLARAITTSRQERTEIEPGKDGIRLTDVLDEYLVAHQNGLIVTEEIKTKPGASPHGNDPRGRYPHGVARDAPCTQIATHDGKLRFDKDVFKVWLYKQGKSPMVVFRLMHESWQADGAVGPTLRGMIGAGDRWRTNGRVNYVELDLNHPDLIHILNGVPTTVVPAGTNVIPIRPRPTKQPPNSP
jgi:hypothetical protein